MKTFSFLTFALLASTAVQAQQVEAPKPDAAAVPNATAANGDDADTIVVSATRTPIALDRVAASITVLDKSTIDRMGNLDVADLLVRTPGVSYSRNGGYGTTTSLRIRGAEAGQTVVVVDGVKINDPSATDSGFNFANLMTGDASRIEVLRGPQSILWGSQAIGGVVNVVTPLPEKALEASMDVEGGSRQTGSARAGLGGKQGPVQWRIGASAFTTGGISAIAPAFGGVEKDGYTNQTLSGRAVVTLTDAVSVDLRGYYSNGNTDIDAFNADSQEYALDKEFIGYAGLNVDLFGGRLRNRFAYGYTHTDRDNYNPLLARQQTFDAAGRNRRLEYQGSLAIVKGVDAVFGVEDEKSNFRSVSPPASLSTPIPAPARGDADITSEYAQINAEVIEGLTLTGGLRHDDHSRFGGKTLFAGGGVWKFKTGTIVRANYSEGFKAPSLYQNFSQYGNTALNPERAKGWEAGVEQRLLDGKVSFGGTYFERRLRDLIIFASCTSVATNPLCVTPGTTTFRFGYYANVSRAFARGIEAAAHVAPIKGLSIDGNYTWTQSEDRSPGAATYGFQLARRPVHAWNVSGDYTFEHGPSFGVAARWSGDTFDDAAHATLLKAYTLVDLRAEMPVASALKIFIRAENVFDKVYMTTYRYGTLGRSIYAGFRGRF